MAKKKKKKTGKGTITKAKVIKASEPRTNVFEGISYLDSLVDAYDVKPLTDRQNEAYKANLAECDALLQPRVEKLTRGFCLMDEQGELEQDDKELLSQMLTKMARQVINPFVTAPTPVWDLEKLGISEEDFQFIVDTVQNIHGVNILESGTFLDEVNHLEQKAKNVYRTLQAFLLGSSNSYNRKNLHNSRMWSDVINQIG